MITLEVEYYSSLEILADDIRDALMKNLTDITSKDRPMKVELDRENYDKVMEDLKSFASYGGIRTESEIKTNTWEVAGEFVSFIDKSKDGSISD